MGKRGFKNDEAFENFLIEMQEMTEEELIVRTQLMAGALRYLLSDKEKVSVAKRLCKSMKSLIKSGIKAAAKKKKAAKRAKALSKKMINNAREVSMRERMPPLKLM
jgi:hypothetical protein